MDTLCDSIYSFCPFQAVESVFGVGELNVGVGRERRWL